MRARRLQMPEDRPKVLTFLERAAAGGRPGLSENKLGLVERDDGRPGTGVIFSEGEEMVAYAGLAPARRPREWAMELVTSESPPEITRVLDEVVRVVVSLGGDRLRWWCYDPDTQELPPRLGFVLERHLLRMSTPVASQPAATVPEGISMTGFVPGRDEEAWLAVNNAAFADHRENGALTLEDLRRRMALPWFEPEGLRMAWDGDELAGFCWTKVHASGEGEIYIIATSPAHQGRGLGKALVLEGVRHLAATGCDTTFLFTDSDNTAAVGLYERLGFTVDRVHAAFVRDLGGE